ncbi:MTFP1-like protein, partial [Mya arenaria]
YANEVGEAFRSQVHVNIVRSSYGVASVYVVADAIHKGREAGMKTWPSEDIKRIKVGWAVADTLLWQGLASVIIPGFTINRICALSTYLLGRSRKMSPSFLKWTVTGIGLACIPFIIEPIDRSVDYIMESTFRKFEGPIIKKIVKHHRND